MALADVLGPGADILASDRDAQAMDGLDATVCLARGSRGAGIQTPLDPVLNSRPHGEDREE